MLAKFLMRCDPSSGSCILATEVVTDAALNGSPLWKVIPSRSLNSSVLSEVNPNSDASRGMNAPS